MKHKKRVISLMLGLIMLFGICDTTFASNMSDDEFLLSTGMSQEEIDNMDPDIKEYIVANLRASTVGQEVEYIHAEASAVMQNRSIQPLSGITFSAPAWQAGGIIHIYPTYEFTTAKRPKGADGFAFEFGNALDPYEYGGKIWCKDINGVDWLDSGSMVANLQSITGAGFTGNQLGTPDFDVYLKGCTYAKAVAGSGSSKKITMQYMHNPNKRSYSLSFSYQGIGFGFSSSQTIYTAASTVMLSY